MNTRLTAAFPRKSNGRTIHRALASLVKARRSLRRCRCSAAS